MVLKMLKTSKLSATDVDSHGSLKVLVTRPSSLFTLSIGTLDRGAKGARPGAPNAVTIPLIVVFDANPGVSAPATITIGSVYCGDAAVSISDNCQPFATW